LLEEKAKQDLVFQSSLQLSFFFRPLTFLNAQRQKTCRYHKNLVSIDDLQLVTTWNRSELSGCPFILSVEQLSIQGALFDGQRLSPVESHQTPLSSIPTTYFGWVSKKKDKHLVLPLYERLDREKLVTYVDVPCGEEEGKEWILASVAFFLEE
jgi:hypothetical protein